MRQRIHCVVLSAWTILIISGSGLSFTSSISLAQTSESTRETEEGRLITPAGWGTKSKLAAGWLFYPKILQSIVGLYAYPVTADGQCKGTDLKPQKVGATALIMKGIAAKEDEYTKGRLWVNPTNVETLAKYSGLKMKLSGDVLCVTTATTECKIGSIAKQTKDSPCLFLTQYRILGAKPLSVFWVDLGSDTFYKRKFVVSGRETLDSKRKLSQKFGQEHTLPPNSDGALKK